MRETKSRRIGEKEAGGSNGSITARSETSRRRMRKEGGGEEEGEKVRERETIDWRMEAA